MLVYTDKNVRFKLFLSNPDERTILRSICISLTTFSQDAILRLLILACKLYVQPPRQ
jgi:hypothetical protein